MRAADVLVGGNSPFVLQEGQVRGCGRSRRHRRAPAGQERGPRQREPALHRAHRHRPPSRAGRSAAGDPRQRTARLDNRAVVDGVGTRRPTPTRPTRPPPASCSPNGCTSRSAARCASGSCRPSGFEIDRAPIAEQLRQAPRAAIPRANRHVDRRPCRRTRRHVADHRHRSVAARVPAARARPLARAASHARVRLVATATRSCRTRSCTCSSRTRSCSTRSPRASNGSPQGTPAGFIVSRELQQPKVETAIRAEAIALRLVALLVALALTLRRRAGTASPGVRRST